MTFSAEDKKKLIELGIDVARASRQVNLLRTGQVDIKLERPCIPHDGITQIQVEAFSRLDKHFANAARAGRLLRFVPASGAASRMFAPLHADSTIFDACLSPRPAADASPAELDLRRFLQELQSFAFYPDLKSAMSEDGYDLNQAIAERNLPLITRYLLEPCGLGYAQLPKGLLAFHAAADGARTPFIEHLAEAALLNGLSGSVQLHFTVSAEHLHLFKAQLAAWRSTIEETYGTSYEVTYSTQKPSTDTLALNASGLPLRNSEGQLILRPGGHGALLENLNDLAGDIILVRNIDNVVPDAQKAANLSWTKLLTGYLVEIQEEQHALLKTLHGQPDDPVVRDLVISFLADRLQSDVALTSNSKQLMAQLDRPIRVCGMVPNSGEPGGGPFWVRDEHGWLTRQIVEGAQIDKTDPEQARILASSTHFNPVDMVCGVRDWQNRPYDLKQFIDEEAVIVTSKQQEGREVRVLELPGLWNGSMAGWHTLFVEIPPEAFNPVKTVYDLLRPSHQA